MPDRFTRFVRKTVGRVVIRKKYRHAGMRAERNTRATDNQEVPFKERFTGCG